MFIEHLKKVEEKADRLTLGDFPDTLEWVDSPPLSLNKELKGKLVVLCFWTGCCITCRHLMADLNVLAAKHQNDPVAFISVHSPKFSYETNKKAALAAIEKEKLSFPTLLDPKLSLWDRFGIKSWPTVAVIGPKGNLLLSFSGEGNLKNFDQFIQSALNFYPQNLYSYSTLPVLAKKKNTAENLPLRFPGAIAIDHQNHRLIIADTGHHRIILTTMTGSLIDIIGRGVKGFSDGLFFEASFSSPQGIVYHDHKLYVADTANHAIRIVDLRKKTVSTLAGNGKLGKDKRGGEKGALQSLNTPWNIVMSQSNDRLYISMPGLRQIWVHEFASGRTHNYSGNGIEDNLNSSNPSECSFGMPTGLAIAKSELLVLDSESSSLRAIDLIRHNTKTLAGGDPQNPHNLFYYGDLDGAGSKAKFQYPTAIAFSEKHELALIADTYNNRLKAYDLKHGKVIYFAGSGKIGNQDGKAEDSEFFEPSGIAFSPDEKTAFIADTNNHQIRTLDMTSKEVKVMKLTNIPSVDGLTFDSKISSKATRITLPPVEMREGQQGQFVLRIKPPIPYRFAAGAPSRWNFRFHKESGIELAEGLTEGHFCAHEEVVVPFICRKFKEGETIVLEAIAYYRGEQEDEECYIEPLRFEVPLNKGKGGPAKIIFEHILQKRPHDQKRK